MSETQGYNARQQAARVLELAASDRRMAQAAPDTKTRTDYVELAKTTLRAARDINREAAPRHTPVERDAARALSVPSVDAASNYHRQQSFERMVAK